MFETDEYLQLVMKGAYASLNYERNDFLEQIEKKIMESNAVFMYRANTHSQEQHETLDWIKSNSAVVFDVIDINLSLFNEIETIYSDNNEKIYCLNLNESNILKFMKHFKLPSNEKNQNIRESRFKDIYSSEVIYGDYNYIFSNDNKVIMLIDGYTLQALIVKQGEIMKKR